MLYLIDGTGPRPDKEYAIDMAGSFCNQLRKQLGERCHYMRGPSATGIEVPSLVGDMTDFIVKDFEKSAQSKIFLGGIQSRRTCSKVGRVGAKAAKGFCNSYVLVRLRRSRTVVKL